MRALPVVVKVVTMVDSARSPAVSTENQAIIYQRDRIVMFATRMIRSRRPRFLPMRVSPVIVLRVTMGTIVLPGPWERRMILRLRILPRLPIVDRAMQLATISPMAPLIIQAL